MFTGFTDETVQFFLDLRFHNERSWFHSQQDRYHRVVTEPFYSMIDTLGPAMKSVDPLMEIRPYKCMSHINRDVRFTKDKSPYRDHMWYLFRRAGEPRERCLHYWFCLGADFISWGMGFWGEHREACDLLRNQIAAHPREVESVVRSCELKAHGLMMEDNLFRRMEVPDTVPDTLRPLYLSKNPCFLVPNPPMSMAFRPDLAARVEEDFLTLAPMYRLLRGCVDDAPPVRVSPRR